MLNGFGWPHLLIIAVLLIVLFGAKRLPDAARGIGRSLHIFRSEVASMHGEDESQQPPAGPPVPPQQQITSPATAAQPQQPVQPPMPGRQV